MYSMACNFQMVLPAAAILPLVLRRTFSAHAVNVIGSTCGALQPCCCDCTPKLSHGVQTRLSPHLVSGVEAVLGEHEADLEFNQQRSPKPGQQGPRFPAQSLLDVISQGIQVWR